MEIGQSLPQHGHSAGRHGVVFSMPVTPPARTGTVNGSFSHTHTLTHLHSKALFFFFDVHASRIFKLIIGQNWAYHANFTRVGGGGG